MKKMMFTVAFSLVASTAFAAGPKVATVDQSNWRRAASHAIAEAQAQPDVAERLFALRGIDPRYYLRDRIQNPSVSAELRRMKLPAGALFEVYLETFDAYPFASADAYPAHVDAAERARLRTVERSALRQGLVDAIGASGHPVAPYLLADVVNDARETLATRSIAAMALGATRGEKASTVLTSVATSRGPNALRSAAIAGLGEHRDAKSVGTLIALANAPKLDDELRAAAITGLGAVASKHTRRVVGAERADQAAIALVKLFSTPVADAHGTRLVEAVSRTGSRAAYDALKQVDTDLARRAVRRLARRMR